jgi:thymidylate kinase
LLSYIQGKFKFKDYSVVYLQEPVDIWNTIKDSSGKTILEKYYSDQYRYAFSFQMMAYITRLSQIKKAIKNNTIIITERCLYTDHEIFAKMLYSEDKIEEIEYLIYMKWFTEFMDFDISGYIYLETSPENCSKRVFLRNRVGEESIPLEYLKKCHSYHSSWMSECNRIIIDGNLQFGDFTIDRIYNFIKQFVK